MIVEFDDLIITKYEVSLLVHIMNEETKTPLKFRKISPIACFIATKDHRHVRAYTHDRKLIADGIRYLLQLPKDTNLDFTTETMCNLDIFNILDPAISEYVG